MSKPTATAVRTGAATSLVLLFRHILGQRQQHVKVQRNLQHARQQKQNKSKEVNTTLTPRMLQYQKEANTLKTSDQNGTDITHPIHVLTFRGELPLSIPM